jgi:hypothetical protein
MKEIILAKGGAADSLAAFPLHPKLTQKHGR